MRSPGYFAAVAPAVVVISALVAACAAPVSPARVQDALSVAAYEPESEASPALLRACEAAPLLSSWQSSRRAMLTKTSPRFTVRVLVDGDRIAKSEGGLGLGGASRAIPVRIVDMKSKTAAPAGTLGRCFANVRAPAGHHCIVLDYDGDEQGRPLAFEFDFASGMHTRPSASADAAGACPD